jgi:alpha-aminoadipic semialdehyde synthase
VGYVKILIPLSYFSRPRATKADVLLLNEIGLDPGIDHCSAISLVNRLKAEGKRIVAFTSFCGGLPAPDVAVVPLRYKFSWSPRGVLTAALNSAKYKLANEVRILCFVPLVLHFNALSLRFG